MKELKEPAPECSKKQQCIQELTQVIEIGPVKAKKIEALGGSLLTLRNAYLKQDMEYLKAFKLTQTQLLGLKYFEDIQNYKQYL